MEKIQFSIIVSVLHESDKIDLLIDHLNSLECREGSEIIVVDGSPELDTIDAIRSEQVIKMSSAKGRGRQMNVGASVARGEILIFLHADTELPTGALRKIASVVGQDKYVGGAFELGIKSEKFAHKSLARLASIRCRLTRIPYGDQAIFIRRDYFKRIGGYKEIPLMEDVELMRRIKHFGEKICIVPARVMTSPRRLQEEGFVYTSVRNTVLFSMYVLGVSPEKLAHFYKSEYRGSKA